MSYLYALEGVYAELQAMELDDETFNDTLESIDFQQDLEQNIEYFVKLWKNAVSDAESFKQAKQEFSKKEKNANAKAEKYKEAIERALKMSNKKKGGSWVVHCFAQEIQASVYFRRNKNTA